jgi:hypothetical protein
VYVCMNEKDECRSEEKKMIPALLCLTVGFILIRRWNEDVHNNLKTTSALFFFFFSSIFPNILALIVCNACPEVSFA